MHNKTTPSQRIRKGDLHVFLGQALLAKMRADGEELINTDKGSWLYSGGCWELHTSLEWLEVRIQGAGDGLNVRVNTRLRRETREWIIRRPELWRWFKDIPWDQHGKVPTRSGLIDPTTGELEPARPDHYCTWRIEVDYDPSASCPWWDTMINDMFGDKRKDEQSELVRVVQELMGAALIDNKPRGLRKACVFWGNENRAKSGVLDVVQGLIGSPITASVGSVEGTHGLMPFVRRAPWILHEAFNPGQWHIPSAVKAIVTGNPVQINIKNGPMLSQIVRAPIFWATNGQPQFKEATKAIVSRMIVFEVTREFDPENPVGAAKEALRRGFPSPGEFIVATELQGVLNWALAGLKRAKARGFIETTSSIDQTAVAIHRDSNLVAGFIEECVEFDPTARLRIADFCLAFSAWFVETKGENRKLPSNEAINKALKAMGDARACIDRDDDLRDKSGRFYAGMKLKEAGLQYHKTAYLSQWFETKTMNATTPTDGVNSFIPASWEQKEAIIKMRKAFERRDRAMTSSPRG